MSAKTSKVEIVTEAGAAEVIDRPAYIDSIRWVGASTAADALVVTDLQDNVLFESVAPGPDYVEESSLYKKFTNGVSGVKVPTMDSGKLYLYYWE